jgi:cytidylate kinase
MAVIAMTREMGSRGRDVAFALVERLGLEVVQHEMIEHVAERMHMRESAVNHLLEGTANLFERWGVKPDDLSLYTSEEILDRAESGNVLFRGWGATHVLRKVPHVLCVRVCASNLSRAREISKRIGVDDANVALREVRKSDEAHGRVMRQLFHADWQDPTGYDIVLNSDRLSTESCVDLVVEALRRPEFEETDASLARLRDLRVEAQIRTALRENPVTNRINPSFEATLEPGTGRVTLSGVVLDYNFKNTAYEVVSSVKGVTEVVDEVIVPGTAKYGP